MKSGLGLDVEAQRLEVWRLRLDLSDDHITSLVALLSPDESERAERFVFQRDRRRFVAARGQLRQILGTRLGIAATEVRFEYGPYGKPRVADAAAIEFNLAHSGELALAAFTHGGPTGVDIEHQRHHLDLDGIARRFFAAGEVARWAMLSEAEREAAFFRCWTRKEAYLKAHGAGLSISLNSFEVSFAEGELPRLLWTDDGTEHHWVLFDVTVPSGYTAAAATAVSERPALLIDRGEWPADAG